MLFNDRKKVNLVTFDGQEEFGDTEGAIRKGQSREYRRGNKKRTIQRIPKGQ
jgi:hypothetical protein